MDNFEQYWEKLCTKNPLLRYYSASVASFKRELKKAFEAGQDIDYKSAAEDFAKINKEPSIGGFEETFES